MQLYQYATRMKIQEILLANPDVEAKWYSGNVVGHREKQRQLDPRAAPGHA